MKVFYVLPIAIMVGLLGSVVADASMAQEVAAEASSAATAPASASGRGADIKAQLEKLSGADPIERVVAAEEALGSEDPLMRSLALEKMLQSDDSQLRVIGLRYLVSVQKQFVVEISVSEKELKELDENDNNQGSCKHLLSTLNPLTIEIRKFDKELGQFEGYSNKWASIKGAIAQDGITMLSGNYNLTKLQFSRAEGKYLVGSFTCATMSYAAKSVLP